MSAVYGRLQGNRGEVTRTGSKHSGIMATLNTYEGKVRLVLEEDGSFVLDIESDGIGFVAYARGNANKGEQFVERLAQ